MKKKIIAGNSEILFDASEDDAKIIARIVDDLLTKSGYVNLDAEDVNFILDGAEKLKVGEGFSSGQDRAKNAAREAVKNFAGAKKILIEILTGDEVSLKELSDAAVLIEDIADPDAQILWGHVIDESAGEKFSVSVIAIE